MDRKIRRKPADQPADADVLDDRGIHSGGDDRAQVLLRLGHFVFENQRVERHVALHAAAVEELHQLRQVGFGEVVRAHPGIELLQAEINGVRAVLDGGFGTFPVAGRREQFRKSGRGRAVGGDARDRFDTAALPRFRLLRSLEPCSSVDTTIPRKPPLHKNENNPTGTRNRIDEQPEAGTGKRGRMKRNPAPVLKALGILYCCALKNCAGLAPTAIGFTV